MNGTRFALIWMFILVFCTGSVLAQEKDWPRTVAVEQGTVTLYAPQVDELDDATVHFRSALAWRPEPGADPVFGVGWFEADVVTNRFAGSVHPVELRLTQTRFPADAPDLDDTLAAALARPGVATEFTFSLAALESSLAGTQAERQAAQGINTRPPKIIYRDRPALLVTLDGAPVLREIENSPLEAVINTPYPLIHDGRYYWLNVADGAWYQAKSATGPYAFASQPPADVAAVVRIEGAGEAAAPAAPQEPITARNAPEIIVTTEPAELIVTEGPAAFVPLVDDLLVLQNSDDDVFMHVSAQQYYIVLSGRWYRARSLNGPWAFHAADELPPAFAAIPLDSDQAGSRVYVAGTEEAEEAVLDAQLPQTAAVERGTADIDVEYDGRPEFARVDGTDMVYARNTGSTVIRADGLYYLVEDGVWYVSASPYGPWDVSVARPGEVPVILPSSPVYPVKYVYIYDYTPDVVYVGYTPGYVGSYVYSGTVFYGSGWYYRPWISPRYYYPRHSTWGFHVSYNPWSGWGFGLSWYWGPFSTNYYAGGYWHHHRPWHHRHYSYWGPCGYRPSYGHYAHRRPGYGGHRPVPYQRHSNLYRDARQPARVVRTHDRTPHTRDALRPDVRAARKPGLAERRDLANAPYSRAAKGKSPAAVQPVRRTDLAAKAAQRDRAVKAPQRKQPAPVRPDAKRDIARAGGSAAASPSRALKRETLADLGKLRAGKEPSKATRPDTRKTTRPAVRGAPPAEDLAGRTTMAANGKPPRQASDAPSGRSTGKASRQRTEPIKRSTGATSRAQVQAQRPAPAPVQRQPQPTYRYTAPQPQRGSGPASVARTPSVTPAPQPSRQPKNAAPPRKTERGDRPSKHGGKPDRN
jgi:hypothetical protein